jgi:hypothetical protein
MSDDNHTLPYPDVSTEHPTLVIPADSATPAVPKRRRRRWPWVLLIIVVLLAALVGAAEFIARSILPGIVRGIVIEQLDLPADQQIDVQADGILLPQLIGGRLDALHLSSESVTIGGITGEVAVDASDVPLNGADLGATSGTVRIDQDQFTGLVAASDLPIESLTLEEPNVTAAGSFTVLGIPVPIALTLTPGADAGELLLTPVSLSIAGATLDAQEVADRFGSVTERFTQTQRVCIADRLPAGLTLTGLVIEKTTAVIDIDVNGAIVSDAGMQANGVCP